jgi:hypothetical protein
LRQRNVISVYNTEYDEAVDLTVQFGVVSSKPRTTGRQRNRAGLVLPGLWDIIPTLLSIFLLQMKTLAEFVNLPYKHHIYAIHPPVLVCLN